MLNYHVYTCVRIYIFEKLWLHSFAYLLFSSWGSIELPTQLWGLAGWTMMQLEEPNICYFSCFSFCMRPLNKVLGFRKHRKTKVHMLWSGGRKGWKKTEKGADLSFSGPLFDLSMSSTGTEPVRLVALKSLKSIEKGNVSFLLS